MRELPYSVADVFAERAMEGNALAVIHDAQGLSDADMQSIAREMNLSETAFIIPGDPAYELHHGVHIRIFTTEEELPFAGHPTLGTASWLHANHPTLRGAPSITLLENVGPIEVRFPSPNAGDAGIWASMRQNDPVFGVELEPAAVAAVTGLEVGDLLPGLPPQIVSTGNAFCIVALCSLEALQALAIPQREATAWLRDRGARWFYCIAPSGEGRWRARMQFYGGEDPATGSAAGPCVAWLVKSALAQSGIPVVIEQGIEIRRPSRIVAEASIKDGRVCAVLVSGRTIPVAQGRLFLP